MIARLLCLAGVHQWETNQTTTKEPLAADDGLLMVKIVEETSRFCVSCPAKGGVTSLTRYEIFDDYYEGNDA